MALTTLKSLNAEIRQLEGQKKLVEKRDGEVPKALAVLQRYAKVLTPAQRRQIAKIVGESVEARSARAPRVSKSSLKGRKLGAVAPKYRLPTGETWTGRGLSPKAFSAWAKSAAGKAWAKANPDAKFPPADGVKVAAPVVKKAAKKATKVAKKVARKTGKKPGKTTSWKAAKKA